VFDAVMNPDPANLISEILNTAYMVRYYKRGSRTTIGRLQRDQAVLKLALIAREALNTSDQFEPILEAIVEGLRPSPDDSVF